MVIVYTPFILLYNLRNISVYSYHHRNHGNISIYTYQHRNHGNNTSSYTDITMVTVDLLQEMTDVELIVEHTEAIDVFVDALVVIPPH